MTTSTSAKGVRTVSSAAEAYSGTTHSVMRIAAGWPNPKAGGAQRWLQRMPKGLMRALLIIILPMVILQSVIAFVFMERHWNVVTQRLSAAVVQDISALIDVYGGYPQDADRAQIRRIAQERLGLAVDFLPLGDMPPPGPKPFFSLLDQSLSEELRKQIAKPYWIDTVGKSALVEIRIQLDNSVMRVFARRSAAYASNSKSFCSGWSAPRWCCFVASPSFSCATRSSRS